MRDEVGPKWVLVNGKLRDVSEFAHVQPRVRPATTCPICQRNVILKLGSVRTHHYAHRPEDICIASQPETALHINAKFHIYNELLRAQKLYISEPCRAYCGRKRLKVWLQGWDKVEVEYAVSSFRPDVTLLSNNRVMGAIEVLVTHSVQEQKAHYFAEANIPWLEVKPEETFYQGESAWTTISPIPFYRIHPLAEEWICDQCTDAERARIKRAEYEQSNYEGIHAAKMVDFYFRSGKKYREVYFVMKLVRNNEWVKAWVKTERNQVIASIEGPITKESLGTLNRAVKRNIAELQQKGALIDEFMEWRLWIKGNRFIARDTGNYPFRYHWDAAQSKWVLEDLHAYGGRPIGWY
jgi:hypothetical protein